MHGVTMNTFLELSEISSQIFTAVLVGHLRLVITIHIYLYVAGCI